MIALLTGPPGVGKSTVAARIAALYPDTVETVGFGRLVYQAVASRVPLSYREFRSTAAAVTTAADLSAASDKLASLVAAARSDGGCLLIESHAVARETFGWQAHPDSASVVAAYGYEVLIHLDAPPRLILSRSQSDDGGRLARDEREVSVLSAIQVAVSVNYSAVLGVPLNVVDASGPVSDVVTRVCELLRLPAAPHQLFAALWAGGSATVTSHDRCCG